MERLSREPAKAHTWFERLRWLALRKHAEQKSIDRSLDLGWSRAVVTPHELAAVAYFPKAVEDWARGYHDGCMEHLVRLLSQPQDHPGRMHLIRFRDYWNDSVNVMQLDELTDPRDWPLDGECMQPRQLLNTLRLAEKQAVEGEDMHFSYLDDVAEGPIGEDKLQLQVLRSRHRILDVARRLKNCASMYSRQVEGGEYVLVALVDSNGKPHALAGWEPGRPGVWAHRPVLSLNRPAAAETLSRFDTFLPRLRAAEKDGVFTRRGQTQ